MSAESGKDTDSSEHGSGDSWPEDFNGEGLFENLINHRPTGFRFDVAWLVTFVESELASQVVDIPLVTKGSNNFVSLTSMSQMPPHSGYIYGI